MLGKSELFLVNPARTSSVVCQSRERLTDSVKWQGYRWRPLLLGWHNVDKYHPVICYLCICHWSMQLQDFYYKVQHLEPVWYIVWQVQPGDLTLIWLLLTEGNTISFLYGIINTATTFIDFSLQGSNWFKFNKIRKQIQFSKVKNMCFGSNIIRENSVS